MPDSHAFRLSLHHAVVTALTFAACLVASIKAMPAGADDLSPAPKIVIPSESGKMQPRLECDLRLQFILDAPLWIEGTLQAERGRFLDPENLSMDAGTTGGFRLADIENTESYGSDEGSGSSESLGSLKQGTQSPNSGSAGSLISGNSLIIQPGQAVDRLGVDLTYHGFHDDILRLRLNLHSGSRRPRRLSKRPLTPPEKSSDMVVDLSILVGDLIRGVVDQELAPGVRLWVGRPGGDAMRVRLADQRSMVFAAGQTVSAAVDLLAVPNLMAKDFSSLDVVQWDPEGNPLVPQPRLRPLDLRMELVNDSTGKIAWQQTITVDSSLHAKMYVGQRAEAFSGELTLPQTEGVYTLKTKLLPAGTWRFVERLARPELLTRPELITHPERLWSDEIIAERSTQMVVLEPQPLPVDPTPMREIIRWTPNQRNWLGLDPNSINTTHPIDLIQHAGATVARLAPNSQISQRIKTVASGRPHVLVVRYARDQPVKMSVSVRQQDAAGQWATLGVDTALVDDWSLDHFPNSAPNNTPAYQAADTPATNSDALSFAEHRVVFWPSSDEPLLILRNENSRADLKIESIAILAGPARLAGGGTVNGFKQSEQPEDGQQVEPRMAAIYLDKPLLTEAFGCDKQLDPNGRVALDDWTTFLQAGQRLVDHVQAAGANAAVISGCSAGGTLFPTRHFTPTPRYDTGIFFSDGRDPIKKDVLELWLRLFERSGLRLVIGLELATPLPRLEALSSESESGVGLSWVDHLGREFQDYQPPRRGVGVYYNVLDERVEAEFTAIIDELVQRYGKYSSLAGIGLQVGPNSMMQLPALSFGRDESTLQKFRNDWQKAKPVSRTPTTRETTDKQNIPELPRSNPGMNAWLDGEGRDAWVNWRASRLTDVFKRMAKRLPQLPLLLITADYRPANLEAPGGDAAEIGLDWAALASSPQIVPLRLVRRRLLVEPARRIEDARLNEDLIWDELLNEGVQPASFSHGNPPRASQQASSLNAMTGGLLYFPPDPVTVSVAESSGANITITLFPQAIAAPRQQVRELARFVDTMDSEVILAGGWTPSVAPDPLSAQFFQSFTSLPRKHFHSVDPQNASSSIVRMRQLQTESALWIYAVNTAAWDMQVDILTDAAAGTPVVIHALEKQIRTIGTPPQTPTVDGLSLTWSGQLRGGQLVVIEVQGRTRGVTRWNAVPVIDPLKEISSRIDDLTARVAILGQPRQHGGLINGDFETVNQPDDSQQTLAQIEGWMRSQHPTHCVRTTTQAAEGRRALVLQTDNSPGARTWLLSSPLNAPETGRLAVSIRAKAISGTPTLRIAVEGRVRGSALRYSVNVQPEGMDSSIPPTTSAIATADESKTTDWPDQAYWLYVTDLPDEDIEDLRIAIDLISPGQVAIDDVQLFDFFFTQRERNELQRQTFVAAERLRRGDMLASARLLDSHWARYLRWLEMPVESETQTGADQPESVSNERNPTTRISPAPSNSTSQSNDSSQSWRNSSAPAVPRAGGKGAPTFAERLRQYLPAPLRF